MIMIKYLIHQNFHLWIYGVQSIKNEDYSKAICKSLPIIHFVWL